MVGYQVADANEYLAVTGWGIHDIEITKKKWVLPFQKCIRFQVIPINYEISINAMSQEKLSFTIPASVSVGPDLKDQKMLHKYIRLLVQPGSAQQQMKMIRERVDGILEGELRAVAASMTIHEIYDNRKEFQQKVFEFLTESLNRFGLIIYNANIRELVDSGGFFTIMGQKAQEATTAMAKVSIAESHANGDIGSTDRNCKSAREQARLKAEGTNYDNDRLNTVVESEAMLKIKEARYSGEVLTAEIEAQKASELKEAELQAKLEVQRARVNMERLRADALAAVTVEAEKIKRMAEARAYEQMKAADAKIFERKKQAEGLLYQKHKEAEGLQQMYQAQAEGVKQILESFNDPDAAMQFVMLERNLFQDLAIENANAIQGMNPKFNLWQTDGEAAGGSFENMIKNLPPLLSAIQDQTGISPPAWLAQMPAQSNPVHQHQKSVELMAPAHELQQVKPMPVVAPIVVQTHLLGDNVPSNALSTGKSVTQVTPIPFVSGTTVPSAPLKHSSSSENIKPASHTTVAAHHYKAPNHK